MVNTVPEDEYNAEYIKKVMEYSKDDIIQGIEEVGVEEQLENICEHMIGDLLQDDEQITEWFKYLSEEDPSLNDKTNSKTDIFEYQYLVATELKSIIGEVYWQEYGSLGEKTQLIKY